MPDRLMARSNACLLAIFAIFASAGSIDALEMAAPVLERKDQTITITCSTPHAQILYTLDGSDPDARSGPYLAPIVMVAGFDLKARAFSVDRSSSSTIVTARGPAIIGSPEPSTMVPVTQGREWPRCIYANRHAAAIRAMHANNPEIVFIGDSITHHWGGPPHDNDWPGETVWQERYAPLHAVNLGYGWDRVENVLWRLGPGDELAGSSPKLAVLMLGTNNLSLNTAGQIALGITKVCSVLHQRQPQTRILLLGILPRGEHPNPDRQKIVEINRQIALLDGHDGVTFLDIGASFLEADQRISRTVMSDFLHPTAKGYDIWGMAIAPTVDRLLGDAKP